MRTIMAAGCVALLLLQGCAPRGPRPLDAESRNSLGAVGVCSVGAAPAARVGGLVGRGKQGAAGAAKNGGIGFAAGVGAGALTGAGVGLACGPFAIICSPVLAAFGAAIGGGAGLLTGGTIGAVTRSGRAIPTDIAEGANVSVARALEGRDLQNELRGQVLELAPASDGDLVDLGTLPAAEPAADPQYRTFGQRGLSTVLEVGIADIGLIGEGGSNPDLALTMVAQARVVRVSDGHVLWRDDDLSFKTSTARLSAWTADGSWLLQSELARGLEVLANQIAADVFPGATTAAVSPR